ncbi:unnamed protein product [Closterium sp. NIES-54]
MFGADVDKADVDRLRGGNADVEVGSSPHIAARTLQPASSASLPAGLRPDATGTYHAACTSCFPHLAARTLQPASSASLPAGLRPDATGTYHVACTSCFPHLAARTLQPASSASLPAGLRPDATGTYHAAHILHFAACYSGDWDVQTELRASITLHQPPLLFNSSPKLPTPHFPPQTLPASFPPFLPFSHPTSLPSFSPTSLPSLLGPPPFLPSSPHLPSFPPQLCFFPPRPIRLSCQEKQQRAGERLTFICTCSFLEIYNEHFYDLLDPRRCNLHGPNGVYVENLTKQPVTCFAQVMELIQRGAKNRRVAGTNMNRESSRSHSVFTCNIESTWTVEGISNRRFGQLNLVDLAGSERQKSSGATGERLKEASSINTSLSQLGKVIMVLVESLRENKPRHVPYRDSYLTFLLQDSLGGNSKTTIIACISPFAGYALVMSAAKIPNTWRFHELTWPPVPEMPASAHMHQLLLPCLVCVCTHRSFRESHSTLKFCSASEAGVHVNEAVHTAHSFIGTSSCILPPTHRSFRESHSTLKFAQRAKLVHNKAVVNEAAEGEKDALKKEIARLKVHVEMSQNASETSQNLNEAAEGEKDTLTKEITHLEVLRCLPCCTLPLRFTPFPALCPAALLFSSPTPARPVCSSLPSPSFQTCVLPLIPLLPPLPRHPHTQDELHRLNKLCTCEARLLLPASSSSPPFSLPHSRTTTPRTPRNGNSTGAAGSTAAAASSPLALALQESANSPRHVQLLGEIERLERTLAGCLRRERELEREVGVLRGETAKLRKQLAAAAARGGGSGAGGGGEVMGAGGGGVAGGAGGGEGEGMEGRLATVAELLVQKAAAGGGHAQARIDELTQELQGARAELGRCKEHLRLSDAANEQLARQTREMEAEMQLLAAQNLSLEDQIKAFKAANKDISSSFHGGIASQRGDLSAAPTPILSAARAAAPSSLIPTPLVTTTRGARAATPTSGGFGTGLGAGINRNLEEAFSGAKGFETPLSTRGKGAAGRVGGGGGGGGGGVGGPVQAAEVGFGLGSQREAGG